ncbi:MAG: hypothetical protein ACD_46C00502G0006 [uncultured bacterium]|nr:MAG: hypothetical protein ACD_46C00502G0006 [uncultured bacterium]
MFSDLVNEIYRLPEQHQLNIIRGLVEGVISLESLLQSEGHIYKLKQHFGALNDFNELVDLFVHNNSFLENDNRGFDLLKEYRSLSILLRITKHDEYQKKIITITNNSKL